LSHTFSDLKLFTSLSNYQSAETAAALHGATRRSLVILDELGRGTSTSDGTALAIACVKHLLERASCLSIVATHYHSLLDEFEDHPNVRLGHMKCSLENLPITTCTNDSVDEGNIHFFYKLVDGSCPKSFGIEVACMADLPSNVVSNARRKGEEFERKQNGERSSTGRPSLLEPSKLAKKRTPAAMPTVSLFLACSKRSPVADKYCTQSVECTMWIGTPEVESIIQYAQFLDHPGAFPHLEHALQHLKPDVIYAAASNRVKSSVVERYKELLEKIQSERVVTVTTQNPTDAAPFSSLVHFNEDDLPSASNVARTLHPLLTKKSALFLKANSELSCLVDTASAQEPLAICLAFYFHVTSAASTNNTQFLTITQASWTNCLGIDRTAAEAIHLWPPTGTTLQQHQHNSVFGILSQPICTAPGNRCLAYWLAQPSVNLDVIQERQESVGWLVHTNSLARDTLREQGLRSFSNVDVDALVSILESYKDGAETGNDLPQGSTQKALKALYDMHIVVFENIPLVQRGLEAVLQSTSQSEPPVLLNNILIQLRNVAADLGNLSRLALEVLDMELAPSEFLVRADYKIELSQVSRDLASVEVEVVHAHERINQEWASAAGLTEATGVRLEKPSAKGWQFSLPNSKHAELLKQSLGDRMTMHRTSKKGVFFSNKELLELSCKKRDLSAEYDRHQQLITSKAMQLAEPYALFLEQANQLVAALDVLVALAHVAANNPNGYVRPDMSDGEDDGMGIELIGGRHPCVELQEHIDFIPNDINLVYGESSFLLVTGPNMVSILKILILFGHLSGAYVCFLGRLLSNILSGFTQIS
jgi:DNA mismatch repair ATPase MutS